jgi:hypothetical protein
MLGRNSPNPRADRVTGQGRNSTFALLKRYGGVPVGVEVPLTKINYIGLII